jgi:hypothetical protein
MMVTLSRLQCCSAAVPTFIAYQKDIEAFRSRLGSRSQPRHTSMALGVRQPYLGMPGNCSTTLTEFNRSQTLISLVPLVIYP